MNTKIPIGAILVFIVSTCNPVFAGFMGVYEGRDCLWNNCVNVQIKRCYETHDDIVHVKVSGAAHMTCDIPLVNKGNINDAAHDSPCFKELLRNVRSANIWYEGNRNSLKMEIDPSWILPTLRPELNFKRSCVDTQGSIGDWEQFEIKKHDNNKVALKSHHGTYISASPDGDVFRIKRDPSAWELFEFVYGGGGMAIKTHHGTYLHADPNGMIKTVPNWSSWETFEIIQKDNGKVALKTSHNTYLKVDGTHDL
jgi:hypothetical protein